MRLRVSLHLIFQWGTRRPRRLSFVAVIAPTQHCGAESPLGGPIAPRHVTARVSRLRLPAEAWASCAGESPLYGCSFTGNDSAANASLHRQRYTALHT